MPAIKACLWFPTQAEEAANYYTSVVPNSKVTHVMRAGPSVIAAEFTLDGKPFLAINGRPESGFNDSHSYLITCESQAEVDHYWNTFVGDGGEEGQCGWLKDRYGVSWQIVPNAMMKFLGDPDPARAGRAMQAMMGMKKLDIAALERAANG